jgi:protein tyrosine phosphatase (PTP) superfamily phosphohydrolase (DUF442 family)
MTGTPASDPTRRKPPYLLRALWLVLAVLLAGAGYYGWWHDVEFRMREIEPGNVYQSCVVRPLALPRIVETYHLKTVLDLRNDPDKQTSVEREREVLTALGVRHVHVPMDPDPTLDEIDEAAKVLLDEDNWPILVHCHHGEGRSVMMAAIFRVLYQDKSVDEALRLSARLPEGLMFVENFARTGITPDNFKADRMREYLEQHAR